MLHQHEIDRLAQMKKLADEIMAEPAGEHRHQFAERVLRELADLCLTHGVKFGDWPVSPWEQRAREEAARAKKTIG